MNFNSRDEPANADDFQSGIEEYDTLLPSEKELLASCHQLRRSHFRLWCCIVILSIVSVVQTGLLAARFSPGSQCRDPTLALWSPANEAVRYETRSSTPYFFNRSPWLGTNRTEIDPMWAELYDYGSSGISGLEAGQLLNSTVTAPLDDEVYLVELQVMHDLHCLNMLRKVAYADQYPEIVERYENGTINHDALTGFHVDHCIDALRQSIQCTTDVTPIKFIHHSDDSGHAFPTIWSTRICRNFDVVRDWAIGSNDISLLSPERGYGCSIQNTPVHIRDYPLAYGGKAQD